MSVMLRCSCGNELTVPDEAALGLVGCPKCHGKIDPKAAVIHPRLDDLDPDLLLAPDDEKSAAAVSSAPATKAGGSTKPNKPADDDFLAMMDAGVSSGDVEDEFSLFADDAAKHVATNASAAAGPESSLLASPTQGVNPPADDDDGYSVVEVDYGSKPVEESSWVDRSHLGDLDDLEVANEKPAKPAKPAEAKSESKSGLRDATPAVRQPTDDLLDDEIMVAPEVLPPTPETCPDCNAPLKPGTILCVACGYNIKLGKRMEAAAPSKDIKDKAAKAKAKKAKASSIAPAGESKSKLKDPRVLMAAGGGGLVLLLAMVGFFMFGGEDPPTPVVTPTVPNPSQTAGPSTTPGPPGTSPDGEASPLPVAADPAKPTLLLSPTGASGRVSSLALSDDGKLLAAGNESGGATIWDIAKGETKPPIAGNTQSPVNVGFHPDGKQLLTGFSGGAKLWALETGTEARSFKTPVDGLWAARISADGASLLASGPTGVLSVVDLKAGGRTKSVKVDALPPGSFAVVDFTPDGKTGIVGGDDGFLVVWDVAAGRPLKLLEGHTTRIAAVAISDDGKQVISAAGGAEYRMVGKERFLMSSRPTDFTVRIWDVGSGKETYRWHVSPGQPVSCVAFSDDGKRAAVVTGDVQVIDVEAKQLVATISIAPPGTPQAPVEQGAPTPPNEPFRLAIFSHDGNRMITGTQSSGIHVWELPTKPEPKPLDGVADPPELATFKPPAWTAIRPLLLTPSAAPDDEETADRLAIASKAAEATAAKNATFKKLQNALAAQPRTPESLLKKAKGCQKMQLILEAEECLRAVLMADPTNAEAKKLYGELKLVGPTGAGPVSITRAWVEEVTDLDDAGQRPDPPKDTYLVRIPIEIAVVDKVTKLDAGTLTGKAGDQEAAFLGIYHKPTGEVQGARKTPGGAAMTGQPQVWEAMAVGKDKSGKTIVQLLNRKIPQSEQPRGGRPTATGTPKVKLVPDTSKVKEDYLGPYVAIFAVPEGETLGEIRWQETTPIRVLAEEPKSLDKLVLDTKADKPQRLAAIEALGVSPTPTAAQTLEKIIASGDDELFDVARAAMRNVRRQANLIAPEYLPVSSDENAHLAAIVFGKIDGQSIPQPSFQQFNVGGATATQVPPTNSYTYCKTLWNLSEAGNYLGRVAMFGPGPDYQKQSVLEFEFKATGPNLYLVQMKTDREVTPDAQLIELWREGKLLERRILSSSAWTASALAARLPLEPPVKVKTEDEEESTPAIRPEGLPSGGLPNQSFANPSTPLMQVFPGTPVTVEASPVFGSKAKLVLPVERAALAEMLAHVPSADQDKIPAALVEVVRLDMGDTEMTKQSLDMLRTALADAATPLFIRLAQVSAPPTALAAITALHAAGEKSAEACRTLIDLQKGPSDIQKPAEDAVSDLMTQGVISQEGDNWRYHNQTHFPEKPKEEKKPEAAPSAE